MELHIITGKVTGETDHKWWAETTNLPKNYGVEITNTTEEECIIALVKSYFRRMENDGEHPINEILL